MTEFHTWDEVSAECWATLLRNAQERVEQLRRGQMLRWPSGQKTSRPA